ncbi:MAG: class I SAM-dependent methyltransferase [Burkholderiaceae bacterium]
MTLRSLLRAVAPDWMLRRMHRWRARQHARVFGRLPLAEAFDRVYAQGLWGASSDEPSGSGSYGRWADEYVEHVRSLAELEGLRTAVDVGCGDFHVGAELCDRFERYEAIDASRLIIERNRERFRHLPHVRFSVLDATREPLPAADLIMIRQVLQHLSNAQIEAVLRNAEAAARRLIVVAEHGLSAEAISAYNVDLGSHSPSTRLALRSCVRIDRPPFDRRAQLTKSIPADRPVLRGASETLDIYLLKRAT